MSLTEQSTLRVVLYEGEGSGTWDAEQRFESMTALLDKGYDISRQTRRQETGVDERTNLLVLGCFGEDDGERRTSWGEDARVRFKNVEGMAPADVAGVVDAQRADTQSFHHGEWKPWFPVIDYDRCTNCMQCLSFCLFGVYGVDDESRIQVQNNDSCKTNCPACSRVCPEAAIMFPKYRTGPINGDAVKSDDLRREKMKVDISSLLGGDIYQMLRDRSEKAKSRFSKERNPDKALTERKKCLTKLAEAGDIPAEVLMALPSQEEIQRRAAEAQAKADAALEARGEK